MPAVTAIVTPTSGPGFAKAIDPAGVVFQAVAYAANAAIISTTLTVLQVTGAAPTAVLAMTGTLAGGATATLPSTATLITALGGTPGVTYILRLLNESAGAFAWTLAAGDTGTVITGTATMAQNTWREFAVTVVSLTSVTLQNIGTGTYS